VRGETGAVANPVRLALNALPWETPLPRLRTKAIERDGVRFRIMEFETGFEEPDWCHRPHRGFLLSGRLEIAFPGRTEVIETGEALDIPAGDAHRHKARPLTDTARLFLIDPL
jgi:quercetin dioxygenase-like cupin family protein